MNSTLIKPKLENQSTLSVSFSLLDLEVDEGYMSKKKVAYNPTYSTVIIDKSQLENVPPDDFYKSLNDLAYNDFLFRIEKKAKKTLSYSIQMIHPYPQEFIEKTIEELGNMSDNRDAWEARIKNTINRYSAGSKYTVSNNKGGTHHSCYWIDWQESLSILSVEEALTYIFEIVSLNNAPVENLGQGVASLEEFINSPFFHFLATFKPSQSIPFPPEIACTLVGDFNARSKALKKAYTDDIINETKRRNLFQMYIYNVYQQVKSIVKLINLSQYSNGTLIYLPFWARNDISKPESLEQIPKKPFINRFDAYTENIKNSKSKRTSLLRLSNMAISFDDISDIPQNFFVKISEIRQKNLDYVTATGLPFAAFRSLMNDLEQTDEWKNQKNYIPFNRTYLNQQSHRRMINASSNRNNPSLAWVENKVSNNIREVLSKWCSKKTNRNRANSINYFLEWVIQIEEQGASFTTMYDFQTHMFYDPMSNFKFDTYQKFLEKVVYGKEKKAISTSTKMAHYNTIRNVFDDWAEAEKLATGENVFNPMPLTKDVITTEITTKTASTRLSMSTALYDVVLEVATENDYQFSKNLNSHTYNCQNYKDGNNKDVWSPNVAHITHLMLLVPARGHQIRWTDEGLLDDKIWDMDKMSYVKNSTILANYRYSDGLTQKEKFGRTGVLRSNDMDGAESLGLYMNTSKTKSKKLQDKGYTGYEIPWPCKSGIAHLQDVYDIIEAQKKHNAIYSPAHIIIPVKVSDENNHTYTLEVWDKLPCFTPLFREMRQPRNSAMATLDFDKYGSRTNLYLPPSAETIRNYFKLILTEADRRFKLKYPTYVNRSVVFDDDGSFLYDLHGLRVFGITQLLDSGVDISIVRALVDHATEIMTLYYHKVEQFKIREALLKNKERKGKSKVNEVDFMDAQLRTGEVLLSNFDNDPVWSSEEHHARVSPHNYKEGQPKFIKGGVCFGYDCQLGGIDIKINHQGYEVADISSVQGGSMRCGNCRFWKTGPRFILDQIFYLNAVSLEMEDLANQRADLIMQASDAYDRDDIYEPELESLRLTSAADDVHMLLAHRNSERIRRQRMLDLCIEVSTNSETGSEKQLSVIDDIDLKDLKWERASKFEAAVEHSLQAAVLGLPACEDEITAKSLDEFYSKLIDLSGQRNPLLYAPSDEVKRLAIVYKLQDTVALINRTFTDEEFKDPRVLLNTLEAFELEKMGRSLANIETDLIGDGD